MNAIGTASIKGSTENGKPRSPWPPVLVGLACCVLVFAALVVADRPAWSSLPGPSFVPDDGFAVFTAGDQDRGQQAPDSDGLGPPFAIPVGTMITESARTSVVQATQSVGKPLGNALLRALDSRLGVPIWRTISRPVRSTTGGRAPDDPAPGDATTAADRTAFYRTDDGIALLASGDAAGVRSFAPALQLLPADPRPGQRWSGSGTVTTADGSAHYASAFRLASTAQGCVTADGTINIDDSGSAKTSDNGPPDGTVTVSQTWCTGAGIATQTIRDDHGTGSMTTVVAPDPSPAADVTGTVADDASRWQHTADWRARAITPVTERSAGDDEARTDPIQGTPASLPPVITSTGLLVRAGQQGSDLVIMRPPGDERPTAAGQRWTVQTRLHPGGTPTILAAAGSMIIVGTTERQLIGYDSEGVRRWQLGLDDVVAGRPAVTGSTMIIATTGGTVLALDVDRGTVTWRQRVGDVVSIPPAVTSDMVAVETASATVIALDLATGTQRWQADRESVGRLAGGRGQFIVSDGREVHAYRAGDGLHRWRRALPSTVSQLLPIQSGILVRSHDSTAVLGPAGTMITRARPYAAVSTDGVDWIGWRSGAADLHSGTSARAAPVDSYRLPELSGTFDPRPVSDRQGCLIFGLGWAFVELGTP